MKTVLFLPLIWIIGYLVADGDFGAKVINGFEWLNIFYIISLVFVSIIMVFVTYILSLSGTTHSHFNIFVGAGVLMWIISSIFGIFYYWITNEIVLTTNALATQWSDLGSTDLIIMYLIIFIIGIFTANNKST
jgi:hypothetical protein